MKSYGFGLESKLTWMSKLIVVSAWNRPLHQGKDVGKTFFIEQEKKSTFAGSGFQGTLKPLQYLLTGRHSRRQAGQEFSEVH